MSSFAVLEALKREVGPEERSSLPSLDYGLDNPFQLNSAWAQTETGH